MIQDLLTLTIIGGILEVFAVKFGAFVFNGAPFVCISLLIMFVAVARWNFYGLLASPLLALAAFLGGIWTDLPYIQAVYGWQMYIATTVGLAVVSLNAIFFIKFGTKKIMSNVLAIVAMMIVDYLLMCTVQLFVYRLCTSGNLFYGGEILFTYINKTGDAPVSETVNLCKYGEERFIYNLFGFVVLIVGGFVLRSQGIVFNVKQRFIDDKINADLDRADEKFSIEEVVEQDLGEESQNSTNNGQIIDSNDELDK